VTAYLHSILLERPISGNPLTNPAMFDMFFTRLYQNKKSERGSVQGSARYESCPSVSGERYKGEDKSFLFVFIF
jgi:hypothetical protein